MVRMVQGDFISKFWLTISALAPVWPAQKRTSLSKEAWRKSTKGFEACLLYTPTRRRHGRIQRGVMRLSLQLCDKILFWGE